MKLFSNTMKFFGMVRAVERGDNVTVSGIDGQIMTDLLAKIFETKAINKAMFTSITSTSLTFDRFFVPDIIYMLTKLVETDGVKWGTKRTCEKICAQLLEKTWFKVSTQEHKPMVDVKKMRELKWKPLPHQTEFLELYGDRMPKYDLRGIILGASPGTGKAQPLDAMVHTPSGWTTMGELSVGSFVSTPSGDSAEVSAVYPQGEKNIFRIKFEDGRSVECCEDHLWKVYHKSWRNTGDGWKVLTLKEIQHYLTMPSYSDRLYVQLTEPVSGSDCTLPIDPYVMGIILGDAHIAKGYVKISTADNFIVNEVLCRLGPDYELKNTIRNGEPTVDYYVAKVERSNRWNPSELMIAIREMELDNTRSHTKFIPNIYLDSSVQNRKSLLQGLMDSDGTVDHCGSLSYSTVSYRLALNVQDLVRSLGGLCKITKKKTSYTYNGEKKEGKLSYNLSIRMKDPATALLLPRKKELTPTNYQYKDSLRLRIKEIDFAGIKEAQCISVNHPDQLYITDHYIVTHNTFTDFMVATCVIPPEIAEVKIIISPKKAIHLVWEKSILQIFKKIPPYWVAGTTKVMPLKNTEYYIFNFEQLDAAIELGKSLNTRGIRYFVIVDESHNFADWRSARTQKLVKLQTIRKDIYFVWASGSPILKSAAELVSFLKCSDPRFSDQAERQFKKIYAAAPGRASEIFNHRLGILMAFLVPKSVVSKTKPRIVERPIKLPPSLSHKFLMSSVREEMRVFIAERLKFYEGQIKTLRSTVNTWLDYHETRLTSKSEKRAFKEYIQDIKTISRNPDLMLTDFMTRARIYERTKLIPSLPPMERKNFRSALSAIKNIKLKVRGEALGTVLSKRRSECAAALALYCKPEEIMKESLSKTLFFASSVLPIQTLYDHLTKIGFNPLMVYGGTNSQLVEMMNSFDEDPNVNPICATMQSLSEAVPVISASTIVLLNRPWRDSTQMQLQARVDRLGQIHPVTVIETTLDTGGEPNVSSTADAIISDIRVIISELVGPEFISYAEDEKETSVIIDNSQLDPSLELMEL